MVHRRKVVLVDDDIYFLQSAKGWLEDEGFNVLTSTTVAEAKRLLAENLDVSAAILDIMMPPSGNSDFESQMGYRSGLMLARWIKDQYPDLTIVGISSVKSVDVANWFSNHDSYFVEKGSGEFLEELSRILGGENYVERLKIFIVHGHDELAKHELKNYLQNTLNLPEPIILHEQPSLGRTIIEKFEDEVQRVDVVFVLLTPDDILGDQRQSDDARRRARQNVIFEMGYFLGKLQRRTARVILLYKGDLELPSDIAGVVYIDISGGIEPAGELIRKEISAVIRGRL